MGYDWSARVASDVALRSLLQAARAWGVSPRRFSGWEPARTTIYEYNTRGQMVRSSTTFEDEWDEASRQMVLALADWEAELCSGCQQPLAETTKPEHEDMYQYDNAIRCHRCTAAERAAEKYQDTAQAGALLYPVHLRPQPEETATHEIQTALHS